jgi:hypothetical protein
LLNFTRFEATWIKLFIRGCIVRADLRVRPLLGLGMKITLKTMGGYNRNDFAMNTEPIEKTDRLVSIDQYRGFASVLMVLVNFMGGINSVPAYLKHAHDIGLTLIDLIAPFFIFAIGLTYGISFRRRVTRDGWWKAVEHFLRRWLILFGIGALMVAAEIAFYDPTETNWVCSRQLGWPDC